MKNHKSTSRKMNTKSPMVMGNDVINLKALKEENSEANRARSMLIIEIIEFSRTKTTTDFIELLSAQITAADGFEQSPDFGALRDGMMNIKAGLAELYRLQHMHKLRVSFLTLGPEHSVITS